ncbi:urocortin-2 [Heterocephalus glaber]|uniref:Urocortin-2 n=1 Tax=Heterocephalus glaber TaxID=10181 RepID=A0AAX6NPD8_HETGA|nr:urocortin-2 [Heterocephalus glaber]
MTRWALRVLTVLILARVLVVPVTPVPAFQIPPPNCSQTTSCPLASARPSATTTGLSSAWGQPSPSPRLGPRITLSLDVPIGLLRILLDQAQTRAAREQAAANAHILAHVG